MDDGFVWLFVFIGAAFAVVGGPIGIVLGIACWGIAFAMATAVQDPEDGGD